MQNKPNFRKSQMNVNKLLTIDYENKTLSERGKNKPNSNPIQTQFKPNSNPIQSQFKPNTNPIYKHLKSPIFPAHIFINRMNQIYCVCCFSVSFDSAKMALYKGNWNLRKDGKKKLNLLKYKGLNNPGRLRPLTGTLFAHSNLQNFLYTDDKQ